MSIALQQEVKRLREQLSALERRLADLENKPKPGRPPRKQGAINAVR